MTVPSAGHLPPRSTWCIVSASGGLPLVPRQETRDLQVCYLGTTFTAKMRAHTHPLNSMPKSKTWTNKQLELLETAFALSSDSPSGLSWAIDRKSGNGRLNAKAGDPAGRVWKCRLGTEYWRVKVGGDEYYVHRIVYFLLWGFDPNQNGCTVDHINRNGLDNSQENLRLATPAMQSHNRRWT